MEYLNEHDKTSLAYVLEWEYKVEPFESGFPFSGKIWLLTNAQTASAGEMAVIETRSSGFATIVGTNTLGVMPSVTVIMHLPNTGLWQRFDTGYLTDAYGRSLTEFGIAPDYFNHPGKNALETVLAMIEEMES